MSDKWLQTKAKVGKAKNRIGSELYLEKEEKRPSETLYEIMQAKTPKTEFMKLAAQKKARQLGKNTQDYLKRYIKGENLSEHAIKQFIIYFCIEDFKLQDYEEYSIFNNIQTLEQIMADKYKKAEKCLRLMATLGYLTV